MKSTIITVIASVLIAGCGAQPAEEQPKPKPAAEAPALELTPPKPIAKAPTQPAPESQPIEPAALDFALDRVIDCAGKTGKVSPA